MTDSLATRGHTVFAVDTNTGGLARLEGRPGVVPLLADVSKGGDLARALAAVRAVATGLLEDAQRTLDSSRRGSLFGTYLGRALEVLSRDLGSSMDPRRVASVVLRSLDAHKPRARYRVGNHPLRVLLGRLPTAWTDWLMRSFIGRSPMDRRGHGT